jgi:hypothetical protein
MNNPVKILFAVENREEFSELIILIRELLGSEQDLKFILFQTHPIFHLDDYSPEYHSLFEQIYAARNPFGTNFKQLSTLKKVLIILSNIPILIQIKKDHKINYILSGVPLIFHRLARLFSPRLIHLAYIRGLLLYSQKTTSVSDRLYFLIKKLSGNISIRFFNNYYADYIFTIGAINKNTLMERHLPETNIYLSGPLVLDQYSKLEDKAQTGSFKKELVYITQAYLWHLDTHGHAEQLASIEYLLSWLSTHCTDDFLFTIRVHPRDEKDIYQNLVQKFPVVGRIDTSPASDFLQSISRNRILVSGLSTLAFEWIYLGGQCLFYTSPDQFNLSREMYERLGISPYLEAKELLTAVRSGKYQDHKDLMDKIFYRHPMTNLKFVVTTITDVINQRN